MGCELEETKRPSHISLLYKYFIHGILFSILSLVLVFGWALIFVTLVFVGFIIGFIIGLIVLFLVVGWLNVFLTGSIWGITVESNWLILIVHGFVLFVALLIASIPQILISVLASNLVMDIALFIIYCFINGYIAKNVAGLWKEEDEETE